MKSAAATLSFYGFAARVEPACVGGSDLMTCQHSSLEDTHCGYFSWTMACPRGPVSKGTNGFG